LQVADTYELHSGQAQPVERVAQRLEAVWERLRRLAEAADLPGRARARLAKAQRLTTQLLATITFFRLYPLESDRF
jgi:hypothetical protein